MERREEGACRGEGVCGAAGTELLLLSFDF